MSLQGFWSPDFHFIEFPFHREGTVADFVIGIQMISYPVHGMLEDQTLHICVGFLVFVSQEPERFGRV